MRPAEELANGPTVGHPVTQQVVRDALSSFWEMRIMVERIFIEWNDEVVSLSGGTKKGADVLERLAESPVGGL